MTLFVGIDVSSQEIDVCFMDSEGQNLHEATVPNDIDVSRKAGFMPGTKQPDQQHHLLCPRVTTLVKHSLL